MVADMRRVVRLPVASSGALQRIIREAVDMAGIVVVVFAMAHAVLGAPADAHAYWVASLGNPYRVSALGLADAYLYSPAFLQVIAPLHLLPLPLFSLAFVTAGAVALYLLAGSWAGIAAALFPPVFFELGYGNINLVLALAIVLAFRWPWLWSTVLLTKVTPGIGLLWFAVRREWRSLALAIGATLAVVVVSHSLAPGEWTAWINVLRTNSNGSTTILPRTAAAAVLVTWGALTDRRWTVVAAATLATPAVSPVSISLLVGVLPLAAWTDGAPARRVIGSQGRQLLLRKNGREKSHG